MRAPTQHRPGLTAAIGWTHPYTGVRALGVFYNDGGNPPAEPAAQPKPGPPPTPAPSAQFTQDDLDRIAAKEKAQGQRAGARQALEDLAKELGFTDPDDVKTFVAAARQAEDAKKTEEQKRQEELDRREQELAARESAAIARERAAIRTSVLAQLGATGTDLDDALALLERDLRDTPDADEATVRTTAEALKERRAALFGAAPAQQPGQMPPAPGGSPAGGPPPRQAPTSKPGSRGLEMARLRGHKRDAA
ncbi:hypothetical protein ACIP2X_37900 [Streptomyces sp. NPDC089424]|uniref:hypothetical protein n=1 Tax=Streptomyces sp. NPDC089424 TaxID=3365917 RepID=UPI00382FFD33